MKKILFIMPFMATSLSVSCGAKPTEYITHKFAFHGTNCKINGSNEYSHDIYENDKNVQYTITPDTGYKLPETIDSNIPYDNKTGVITISEIKADIELSVTAVPEISPVTTYTITFDCTNCKALDEDKNVITSVEIPLLSPYTTYHKFYLDEIDYYKKPLKSLIKVEKTNKNEEIDFDYNPLTGEIEIPIIDNLTVTASGINKTLEECSWAEINEISTTGRAKEFFEVYDPEKPESNCKKVYLKGQNSPHTVRIIDFNHDDLADGSGKAGITFEFMDVISKDSKDAYYSKWDSENSFDYRESVLNTFLNDETAGVTSVINMLPDDLSEEGIIKPVNKLVGVDESGTGKPDKYKALSFEEGKCPKLFPLAYDEIHNPDQPDLVVSGEAGEEGMYEYYKGYGGDEEKDNNRRIKCAIDDRRYQYWLRSPVATVEEFAWQIFAPGEKNQSGVKHADTGVAPAFCI